MSDKRYCDVAPLCEVEGYDGRNIFNCREEEERYQAFKARLMRELVVADPSGVTQHGEHGLKFGRELPLADRAGG